MTTQEPISQESLQKMSKENREKLAKLGEQVFGVEVSKLTKQQMITLITMDMETGIEELSVSVGIKRPTEEKFAMNDYHASMKIGTSGIFDTIKRAMLDMPADKMIDAYLEAKSAAYNLIAVKYRSAENYLRNLVEEASKLDNCPVLGRNNK